MSQNEPALPGRDVARQACAARDFASEMTATATRGAKMPASRVGEGLIDNIYSKIPCDKVSQGSISEKKVLDFDLTVWDA